MEHQPGQHQPPKEPLDPGLAARIARLESMLAPDGTVRCERLVIMGASGTPRIVASVSPSGEAMLEWLDSGQVRRVVVAARADGSAGVMLADPGGTTRLALGTGAGGEAHLACVDAAGRPRITVGTTGNAAAEAPGVPAIAAVALLDESGATRIALRSNDGDAVLAFSDAQRRVRLSAGTFADGTVAVPGMVGEGEGMK